MYEAIETARNFTHSYDDRYNKTSVFPFSEHLQSDSFSKSDQLCTTYTTDEAISPSQFGKFSSKGTAIPYLDENANSVNLESFPAGEEITHPSPPASSATTLLVTNLDYNISGREWKKIIEQTFKKYAQIIDVSSERQTDNSNAVLVKVGSHVEALNLRSRFHREKIGYKRINVSLYIPDQNSLRIRLITVLKDAENYELPLFTFLARCSSRFQLSLTETDLIPHKDIVELKNYPGQGRIIRLTGVGREKALEFSLSSSYGLSGQQDIDPELKELLSRQVCSIHCHKDSAFYSEVLSERMLPCVMIDLHKQFKPRLLELLHDHNGTMELKSFVTCWRQHFREDLPIILPSTFSPSRSDETISPKSSLSSPIFRRGKVSSDMGVPIEHLITCVPGIEIISVWHESIVGIDIKYIQYGLMSGNNNESTGTYSPVSKQQRAVIASPTNPPNSAIELTSQQKLYTMRHHCTSLAQQQGVENTILQNLSREFVKVLKEYALYNRYRMALDHFLTAYSHCFGKQLNIDDYPQFSRLIDLIDAVPGIQVLGFGNQSEITLTHEVQVERFIGDIRKVIKSQPSHTLFSAKLSSEFERIMTRKFDILDYGVCYLEDILPFIPETTITVSGYESHQLLFRIPKKEPTAQQLRLMREFATKVTKILGKYYRCRSSASEFFKRYNSDKTNSPFDHRDFGFENIQEFYDALSETISVYVAEGENNDDILVLTEPHQEQVLSDQVFHLLNDCNNNSIPADEFMQAFHNKYGYYVCLADFHVDNVVNLIHRISHIAQVDTQSPSRPIIRLLCAPTRQKLTNKLLVILMDHPNLSMTIGELRKYYFESFHESVPTAHIHGLLPKFAQGNVESSIVVLRPLQQFAAQVRHMLHKSDNKLYLFQFRCNYQNLYGRLVNPNQYGCKSVTGMLSEINHVVTVRGKGSTRTVTLHSDFTRKTVVATLKKDDIYDWRIRGFDPCFKYVTTIDNVQPVGLTTPSKEPYKHPLIRPPRQRSDFPRALLGLGASNSVSGGGIGSSSNYSLLHRHQQQQQSHLHSNEGCINNLSTDLGPSSAPNSDNMCNILLNDEMSNAANLMSLLQMNSPFHNSNLPLRTQLHPLIVAQETSNNTNNIVPNFVPSSLHVNSPQSSSKEGNILCGSGDVSTVAASAILPPSAASASYYGYHNFPAAAGATGLLNHHHPSLQNLYGGVANSLTNPFNYLSNDNNYGAFPGMTGAAAISGVNAFSSADNLSLPYYHQNVATTTSKQSPQQSQASSNVQTSDTPPTTTVKAADDINYTLAHQLQHTELQHHLRKQLFEHEQQLLRNGGNFRPAQQQQSMAGNNQRRNNTQQQETGVTTDVLSAFWMKDSNRPATAPP